MSFQKVCVSFYVVSSVCTSFLTVFAFLYAHIFLIGFPRCLCVRVDEDGFVVPPGIDITAVASVLKQYIADMPEPLLTYELYEKFIDAEGTITGQPTTGLGD